MKYDVVQLMIPPDKKYSGVGFYSTETKLVEEILDEIQTATTHNAKFEAFSPRVDTVTTGMFTSLMQKDSAIGWLIVKIIIAKDWEIFSTCVYEEFSGLFFKRVHKDSV